MTRIGLFAAALMLVGCTVDAGRGFGTVEEATLSASFEPGGRLGDDGSFLVLGGYRTTPESMRLEVGELRLDELETVAAGSGGVFDPANPPPQYSLCHAGHCHHDDGRLVDYEDIQAELSSGGASEYVTRVAMPLSEALSLIDGDERELMTFLPSRELPEGLISRVQLSVGRFQMTGTVTGGMFMEERYPIRIDLALDGVVTSLDATREVSLDAEAEIAVGASIAVEATFLDELDLSTAVVDGAVVIDGGLLGEEVARRVLSSTLEVTLR